MPNNAQIFPMPRQIFLTEYHRRMENRTRGERSDPEILGSSSWYPTTHRQTHDRWLFFHPKTLLRTLGPFKALFRPTLVPSAGTTGRVTFIGRDHRSRALIPGAPLVTVQAIVSVREIITRNFPKRIVSHDEEIAMRYAKWAKNRVEVGESLLLRLEVLSFGSRPSFRPKASLFCSR